VFNKLPVLYEDEILIQCGAPKLIKFEKNNIFWVIKKISPPIPQYE